MILAIDPGTNCGWALHDGRVIAAGVWNLKGGRFEGGGMRFVRLRRYLDEIGKAQPHITLVAYEEVRRHMGVDAAHIYGGVIAVLAAWCEDHKPAAIAYEAIPVGTIKKFATGKGNANKAAMIEAARRKWGVIVDDNEADARWIAEFASQMVSPTDHIAGAGK